MKKSTCKYFEQKAITNKMREAEKFVDHFIVKNGFPPTYRAVQKEFGLNGVAAAYQRLRHCREKMKKNSTNPKKWTDDDMIDFARTFDNYTDCPTAQEALSVYKGWKETDFKGLDKPYPINN